MKCNRTAMLLTASAALLLTAAPAHAVRFNWGVGTGLRIPGTGIYPSIRYQDWRWGRDIFTDVFVDAGYYLDRYKARRKRERPAAQQPRTNIALRVAPNDSWVYLNGVLIDAYGKDDFALPPGRHRLEFLKEGHRTESVELEVRPGRAYEVDRTLQRLGEGDVEDRRLAREQRPVALADALRATIDLWSEAGPARDELRPRREDEERPRVEPRPRLEDRREPDDLRGRRETSPDPTLEERYRRVNPEPAPR